MSKPKHPKPLPPLPQGSELETAYDALRELALERAKARENEPMGKWRVSLLEKSHFPASTIMRVIVGIGRGLPYQRLLDESGVDHIAFELAKSKDRAAALVYEQAKRIRDGRTAERAQTAINTLLEGDSPNVKAALAALQHTSGWNKNEDGGTHGGGGAKIVYNIQLLHAPKAQISLPQCKNGARNAPEAEIIEIKE